MEVLRNSDEESKKKSSDDIPVWARTEIFINNNYVLQYDEVSNEIEYKPTGAKSFRTLNEDTLFRDLQLNKINISKNNLISLLKSDFVPIINPFKNYFKSLPKWNYSNPDYIDDLANYVKAKNQKDFNYNFKKMLVRTVACAIQDDYYNKTAFILVGELQNTGKSSFIRFLCPPKLKGYISESLNFQDKDSLIGLSDNFIINIDELAVLNKVEINSLKSYFSKDSVKIRHPYDRKPKTTPRRASFFGSTNNLEFLSDETGSVRWICFEIDSIDWEGYMKNIKIDNVWAQAFSLYKKKFEMDLSKEEIQKNELRNQTFQFSTPEIELIQKTLQPGSKNSHSAFLTATDIVSRIISDNSYLKGKIHNVSVGKALKILGFTRVQDRKDELDYPVKGYYVNYLNNL